MAQFYNQNTFTNIVIEEAGLQTSLIMNVSHFTLLLVRSWALYCNWPCNWPWSLKVVFKQDYVFIVPRHLFWHHNIDQSLFIKALISENNLNSLGSFENALAVRHNNHSNKQKMARVFFTQRKKPWYIPGLADMFWLIITCRYRKHKKDGL